MRKGKAFYRIAQDLDISPTVLSEIICTRRIPTPKEVRKLEQYFGVPGRELMPGIYEIAMRNER
jgi:transcriptional regulator with XRE-family HTH domain